MTVTRWNADEYEARMRRLKENAESARVALNNARSYYDGLCNEMRDLRVTYREQQSDPAPVSVAGQDGGEA